MRKTICPGTVCVLTLLLLCLSNGFGLCALAAPEDTEISEVEAAGEDPPEEYELELTEDELREIMEEYLGTGWDPEQITGDSAVVEDAPWTMTWLEKEKLFQYAFDENTVFCSSVPQGMICTGPVEVVFPDQGSVLVYRDGQLTEDIGSTKFSEAGGYHLIITAYTAPEGAGEGMTFYRKDFYFRILDPVSRYPAVVTAPEGFSLKEARRNGLPLEHEHSRGIFLEKDGTYELVWEEPERGITSATCFTLDTGAPFLTFSQDVSAGTARIPLEFHPSETDAQITMEYNGFQGVFTGDTLWMEGNCRLMIEDAAGNVRSYRLSLESESQKSIPVHWVAMSFLVLGGALLWLFYLRRHMKVI